MKRKSTSIWFRDVELSDTGEESEEEKQVFTPKRPLMELLKELDDIMKDKTLDDLNQQELNKYYYTMDRLSSEYSSALAHQQDFKERKVSSDSADYHQPSMLASSSSAAAPAISEVEVASTQSLQRYELSQDQIAWLEHIINNVENLHEDTVLVDNYNTAVKLKDIFTLHEKGWLNDIVIYYYMNLLDDRKQNQIILGEATTDNACYSFNTTFYTNLRQGYEHVARWTIKDKERIYNSTGKLLIPVHFGGNHWYLMVIYVKEKRIVSYDSLVYKHDEDRERLFDWFNEDSKKKMNTPLDKKDWKLVKGKCPQQRNGYDCGVHVLINADYISDDLPLKYNVEVVKLWRKKIAYCILNNNISH